MDTTANESCIEQIGTTAGMVWQALHENGTMSLSKLIKSIDAPRDLVLQSIGWLAREDKLAIDQTKRGRTIGLNG
jgi:hypothetical protein